MNKLLKSVTTSLFLTNMGFVQTFEPAKQKAIPAMVPSAMQAAHIGGHSMTESVSKEGEKYKRNHHEFK